MEKHASEKKKNDLQHHVHVREVTIKKDMKNLAVHKAGMYHHPNSLPASNNI